MKENQVGPFQAHAALKVWRACAPGDGKAPEKKCLEADYLSKLRNKSTTELRDLRRCQQAANRSYGGGGGVAPPVDWEGCLGLTGAMMGPKQVHKAMEDSSFVYRSMYATHLRRWVRHFGAEQLLVLGASRLLSDDRTVRAAEMGRLAAHAGVARAAELVHDSVLDEASPGAKAKGMRAGAFENSREYLLRAPADVTRATAQWLAPHNCELAALLRAHGLAASASSTSTLGSPPPRPRAPPPTPRRPRRRTTPSRTIFECRRMREGSRRRSASPISCHCSYRRLD